MQLYGHVPHSLQPTAAAKSLNEGEIWGVGKGEALSSRTPNGTPAATTQYQMTLSPSALTPEAQATPLRLHGVPINAGLQEEQPYHRQAALLMALGADTAEVANVLHVTTSAVRQWLKTPWFQERVTTELARHGRSLDALFAAEAVASLATMVQLRDTAKSETVRATCAIEIINRHLGKPTVRVEQIKPRDEDPVAEAERLRREINEGSAQLKLSPGSQNQPQN